MDAIEYISDLIAEEIVPDSALNNKDYVNAIQEWLDFRKEFEQRKDICAYGKSELLQYECGPVYQDYAKA